MQAKNPGITLDSSPVSADPIILSCKPFRSCLDMHLKLSHFPSQLCPARLPRLIACLDGFRRPLPASTFTCHFTPDTESSVRSKSPWCQSLQGYFEDFLLPVFLAYGKDLLFHQRIIKPGEASSIPTLHAGPQRKRNKGTWGHQVRKTVPLTTALKSLRLPVTQQTPTRLAYCAGTLGRPLECGVWRHDSIGLLGCTPATFALGNK